MDLGVPETVADQVVVLHGKDIESHKTKITTLETENKTLRTQVDEATATIDGFKELDIDSIKQAADDWKAKAEQAAEEAEEKIAEIKFTQVLTDTLREAGARNSVAVSALIDYDKLEFTEDGTIKGLDEQLKQIKTDNSYLFGVDEKTPRIIAGGSTDSSISDAVVAAARKAAGLPPVKKE